MTTIWIDTETGGLDPSTHSLLTLALVVHAPSGARDHLDLALKHSSYSVEAEAMAVNRIDLVEHHQTATAPDLAVHLVESFLDRHAPHDKALLAGHNVGFDIAFFLRWLRQNGGTHLVSRFSHRTIDTMPLAMAFQAAGWLPERSVGLTELLAHYGVEVLPTARHTAIGDAMATAELFQRMVLSISAPTMEGGANLTAIRKLQVTHSLNDAEGDPILRVFALNADSAEYFMKKIVGVRE